MSNYRKCRNCIGCPECRTLGMAADEIGCSEWESATHLNANNKQK